MNSNIGCSNWLFKTIKAPEGALRVSSDKYNKHTKKRLRGNFLSMRYVYRITEKESSSEILTNYLGCVLSDETPTKEKEFSNDRNISKSNQLNNGLSAKGSAIQILQAQEFTA
jgi:hypothetical protein